MEKEEETTDFIPDLTVYIGRTIVINILVSDGFDQIEESLLIDQMEMVEVDLDAILLFAEELLKVNVRSEFQVVFHPELFALPEFDIDWVGGIYSVLFLYNVTHEYDI